MVRQNAAGGSADENFQRCMMPFSPLLAQRLIKRSRQIVGFRLSSSAGSALNHAGSITCKVDPCIVTSRESPKGRFIPNSRPCRACSHVRAGVTAGILAMVID